ncbi:MAG: HigA family addiction module antitoxin [Bryocella sp.]
MEMYDPCHPGEILRDHMGASITVAALAKHLGMTRANLSMILNGRMGISATVALKLASAFPKTSPRLWLDLQSQYDLAQARRRKRAKIAPLFPKKKLAVAKKSSTSPKSHLKKAA